MAEEKMYTAALEAVQQGQIARARDLFTRLLRSNSSKAEYWLWMSTLVDSDKERIYCLESALRVDPDNEAAKQGLILLGAREAGDQVKPGPLYHRNWEKDLNSAVETPKPVMRLILENPITRIVAGVLAAMIVIGIFIAGINIKNNAPKPTVPVYKVSPFATRTPSPTVTPTITRTFAIRTTTATVIGPTPLWMFLSQTYTPMPIYVNTPHPVIEAYRAGLHAVQDGDWKAASVYFQQGINTEKNAPDLYYYLGEAYRHLGQYNEAVLAFGDALRINPYFAPAFLGRALVYEAINPKSDIEGELNYAIDNDPYYVDAYLERARIRIIHNDTQGALEDLVSAESLFPEHPMIYILRSHAYLKMNQPTVALEDALRGYEMDFTSLPAHLAMAEVYLALNNYPMSIRFIDIYLRYIKNDAEAWAVKAQSEYKADNKDQALVACQQGTNADESNAISWYYCGIIHLERGDPATAINELVKAVNLETVNFDYSMALGKALWADNRLSMAIRQFTSAENIAADDAQRAAVFYNRGQVFELLSSTTDAIHDWESLLALPADQVPSDWREYAQARWDFYFPATATPTPTITPSASSTPTPAEDQFPDSTAAPNN